MLVGGGGGGCGVTAHHCCNGISSMGHWSHVSVTISVLTSSTSVIGWFWSWFGSFAFCRDVGKFVLFPLSKI